MKNILINRKRSFVLFALMIAGLVFFAACNKDDNNGNNNNAQLYTTSGTASGSQVSPPVSSSGTAAISGTYNATTNMWVYTINWSSLTNTATAVEIHGPADVGANGSMLLGVMINTPGITGSASATSILTAQQETDLLAGKLYYTILTATDVSGEIRGQITATLQ